MSLLSVYSEYNNCDQDDGKANKNGNQKVHVQIQGNYSLDKFGVTTYKENYKKLVVTRPFCLVESRSQAAAANAGVLSVLPHTYSISPSSVVH